MGEQTGQGVNRRDFLRTGAAATAALAAAGRLAHAADDGPSVVIVRDKTKKAVERFQVDAAITQRLVDQAVMTLAGKDDVAKAWGSFVGPKDKVAIKFNGLFRNSTTHPEVLTAITNGLLKAGLNPANIVVYDRDERAFTTANVTVNRNGKGPRAYPTAGDYDAAVKAGPVDTRISKILTQADALINVPILKSHVLAGISGALKNHLGTVPNANAFHRDTCKYVADISAQEPVKAKTRICICDGLFGNFDKGPGYSPRHRWDYFGILAATDPVALDAVLADLIKAKRVEAGLSPYLKPIVHIERAAELGLGCADLAKIQRVEADV